MTNALQSLADEVGSLLTGFGLTSSRSAWLTNAVDASELTWALDSTTSMGEGVVEIEDELVYVRRYIDASTNLVIAPDGRGYDDTIAAPHAAGTRLTVEPTFPKTSIKRAVNVAIGRSFPTIWATGSVNLTFHPQTTTYELPSETTQVLGVTYEVYGTSGEWPASHFWSFDPTADTTIYPSGKTITLNQSLTPSRPFKVSIASAPTTLDPADADFSATGLPETARYAIILGACAHLLRFMEPVRVTQTGAAADEYDTKKPYLTGTKLANDMEQQFQVELNAERNRLHKTYPARIHRRN